LNLEKLYMDIEINNRIIRSLNSDPYYNLALEEYLLDHAATDEAFLIFYKNRDSVIIGRNQNPWRECALKLMQDDKIPLARRISGGGTVFHDQGNLNYAMIIGINRYDKQKQFNLLIAALKQAGIVSCLNLKHDLLIDGKKFSGNAFCFRKTHALHHGTLMFTVNIDNLEKYLTSDKLKNIKSAGIQSVKSQVINLKNYLNSITMESIIDSLSRLFNDAYPAIEHRRHNPLVIDNNSLNRLAGKYKSWDWIYGQSPSFEIELNKSFSWGSINILLNVQKAKITTMNIVADTDIEKVKQYIKIILQNRCLNTPGDLPVIFNGLNNDETNKLKEILQFLKTSIL